MSARLVLAGLVLVHLGATGLDAAPPSGERTLRPAMSLRPLSSFSSIRNERERSLALFAEIGKVIEHPRCLNCHPATDRPTQTDAMQPHMPLVVRGEGGVGAAGLHCMTCHHDRNYDVAGVPGAPKWSLAPPEMAWQGKSLAAICRQIKDRSRNGGRNMDELERHMASDELVGWGWHPGHNRTPVPGTQAQFGALFKTWAKSGARCPALP